MHESVIQKICFAVLTLTFICFSKQTNPPDIIRNLIKLMVDQ